MRTLKGILLGTAMYVFVFVCYQFVSMWRLQSYFNSLRPSGEGEIGIDVVTLYHNMGFPIWLALAFPACLIIGCVLVARRSSRRVPVS